MVELAEALEWTRIETLHIAFVRRYVVTYRGRGYPAFLLAISAERLGIEMISPDLLP